MPLHAGANTPHFYHHPRRRERAATKKLKRQLQQERRGAMRELRKDAVFISEEQDAEKAVAKAERRAAGRAGLAIMQACSSVQMYNPSVPHTTQPPYCKLAN